MSEEEKVEKMQVQILRDAFEGMKGRRLKERGLLSWRGVAVLATSLATVGLGSVPIQVAHADQIYVDCKVENLIIAISSAAKGDLLSLTPGCIYTLTEAQLNPLSDPTLGNNGLPGITKTLTIKGNGATITRQSTPAVAKFRIFLVAHDGGDLTISDLTVDNGDTSGTDPKAGRGGGILNLGSLNVTNSTFSHNHGSFGSGAIANGIPDETGVHPVAGNITLSDSVFFDNSGGIGGAIGNGATSTMNLTGCTISHNTTSLEGGGIANQGTAILNKCTISGNSVTGSDPMLLGGGGIVNAGQLFLTDSPISGNSVTGSDQGPNGLLGGGAILNEGQLSLTDSPISGNSVTYTGSGNQNGFGGGLFNVPSATATLTRSNIIGNSATNGGGGILNGAFQGAFGTVTLTSSDVTGNSSPAGGGGISNGGRMTITQSNVTGNNAMGDGGGITNVVVPGVTNVVTLTLTHTNVTGNNTMGNGGGIANVSLPNATTTATLTLVHTDVTNNTAVNPGGGVFNQAGNTLNLKDSTVVGNTPDECGVSAC
jgi:hypothetical protein